MNAPFHDYVYTAINLSRFAFVRSRRKYTPVGIKNDIIMSCCACPATILAVAISVSVSGVFPIWRRAVASVSIVGDILTFAYMKAGACRFTCVSPGGYALVTSFILFSGSLNPPM